MVPSHDQLCIGRKVHRQLTFSAEAKFREEVAPVFNKALERIEAVDLMRRKSLSSQMNGSAAEGCTKIDSKFLRPQVVEIGKVHGCFPKIIKDLLVLQVLAYGNLQSVQNVSINAAAEVSNQSPHGLCSL